ncbi:MAG: prefoldin subunit alpha [Candidatus Hodarchaeales archaeon]|jgi:prefoldin alpha subunit
MAQPTMTEEVVNRVKILQEELDQLQVSLNAIEQQTGLISRVISSLSDAINIQKELKNKKPGDEVLIPIGGSNHILCSIKDPNNTFVSIGSGITLHTDLESSEGRNNKQIENLNSNLNQLQTQYSQFSQMLDDRRQELMKIAQQYQLLG